MSHSPSLHYAGSPPGYPAPYPTSPEPSIFSSPSHAPSRPSTRAGSIHSGRSSTRGAHTARNLWYGKHHDHHHGHHHHSHGHGPLHQAYNRFSTLLRKDDSATLVRALYHELQRQVSSAKNNRHRLRLYHDFREIVRRVTSNRHNMSTPMKLIHSALRKR